MSYSITFFVILSGAQTSAYVLLFSPHEYAFTPPPTTFYLSDLTKKRVEDWHYNPDVSNYDY